MIEEAILRIQTLANQAAAVQKFEYDGRQYTDKKLEPLKEPLTDIVKVRTLSGLVDLINATLSEFKAEEYVVHIEDHKNVTIKKRDADKWARRFVLLQAVNEEETRFSFGTFMEHDAFVIGLQSNFTADGDREYLLKIASNLTAEMVTTSADDGIAQTVGLKAGVTLKTSEAIRSRVSLAPFRTFREVDQPKSDFIVRVKQGKEGAVPQIALFEADGGKWRIDAMQNIAYWLKNAKLPEGLPIAY